MTNLNINAILDNSITENKLSSEIQGKLNVTVPTKISELENDLEFVEESQVQAMIDASITTTLNTEV